MSNRAIRARLDLPTGTAACRPLLSRGAKSVPAAGKMAFDLEGFRYVVAENEAPARGIH